MMNLLIGSHSVSVDRYFPAAEPEIRLLLTLAENNGQLWDMARIAEYLRDKAKRLEENADFIQKSLLEVPK